MSGNSKSGYYGKLPLRGDFIQRNLNPEFIKHWDSWLQNVITISRTNLQEQWLNHYLVSPVWNFYMVMPDNNIYCGLMLPSVDKVGRYFPFAIVGMPKRDKPAHQFILDNQNWFSEAENIALQGLEESINFDQLNALIDDLDFDYSSPTPQPHRSNKSYRVPLGKQVTLKSAFNKLSQFSPTTFEESFNYWWTHGNEYVSGNLIGSNGLPDDNLYTAMLDGRWELSHAEMLMEEETSPFDALL